MRENAALDFDEEDQAAQDMAEWLALNPPEMQSQFMGQGTEAEIQPVADPSAATATVVTEYGSETSDDVPAAPPEPPRVRRSMPKIELVEVDNPDYMAYSTDLLDMFREFITVHCRIPSITYESFHNYLCNCIDVIHRAKLNGVSEKMLQSRFVIGTANGKLAGFFLCYMLPNRMPHISTMDIPYMYSNNTYLTVAFGERVNRYKKLWKARHIQFIAMNKRVARFFARTFKGSRDCGTYMFGYRVKKEYLSCLKPKE